MADGFDSRLFLLRSFASKFAQKKNGRPMVAPTKKIIKFIVGATIGRPPLFD
jgi:hypothetical protein